MSDNNNWKDGVFYSLSGERIVCAVYWETHRSGQYHAAYSGYEHAEEAIEESYGE